MTDTPPAGIGHNQPPDPFDGYKVHIADLMTEARNFLDGEPIATQGQADAIGTLLASIRLAKADADKARVEEKRPHDQAAQAVQSKWKPLLDTADVAVNTAKRALQPWLLKVQAEQDAERAAAELAAQSAQAALEAAARAAVGNDDLGATLAAKEAEKVARAAARAAGKASRAKAHVTGGAKAVGLVTRRKAVMRDRRAALNHYAAFHPDELEAWLQRMADTDVAGGASAIPGFEIVTEQTVV